MKNRLNKAEAFFLSLIWRLGRSCLCFVFIFSSLKSESQNIVPNASFEILDSCNITLSGGIYYGNYPSWNSPTDGTADGFNNCTPNLSFSMPSNGFGFQYPHSGNGYAGGAFYAMNFREFLQVRLDTSLIANQQYCASVYVSLANRSQLPCNNIGMYFSSALTYIPTTSYLNFVPQINDTNIVSDTSGWTLIYGHFTATGGERYLIIGNFYSDSLTDTLHMNGNFPGAYYFLDDVNVHCCSCDSTGSLHDGISEIKESEINICPNPANNILTIDLNNTKEKNLQLVITNLLGQMLYASKISSSKSVIDISAYPSGVYFISLKDEKERINKKFVKE